MSRQGSPFMLRPEAVPPVHVLGAGPAGLAAAYTLAQAGRQTVVYERGKTPGGMAASFEHNGFILDYGPHFMTQEYPAGARLWHEVLGPDRVELERSIGMYWRGRLVRYPHRPRDLLTSLGPVETMSMVASLAGERLSRTEVPRNYAERARSQFGPRAFERFIRPQVEKLWGTTCEAISPSWQAGAVRRTTLRGIARRVFRVRGTKEPLLHPRLGSGQTYARIAEILAEQEQPVRFSTDIRGVEHEHGRITRIAVRRDESTCDESVDASDVVSSIPVPVLLAKLCPAAPDHILHAASSLRFRNTVLVYVAIGSGDVWPHQTVYVPDRDLAVGRITNFANWSPAMRRDATTSVLCCEYWCSSDEARWTAHPDEDHIAQAISDLSRMGLAQPEEMNEAFVKRIPRSHPIMSSDAEASLSAVHAYLERFENLRVIGRGGAFRYQDQDGVLTQGIEAAESILEARSPTWT